MLKCPFSHVGSKLVYMTSLAVLRILGGNDCQLIESQECFALEASSLVISMGRGGCEREVVFDMNVCFY